MKLQITGTQLAGVLQACIAYGFYNPLCRSDRIKTLADYGSDYMCNAVSYLELCRFTSHSICAEEVQEVIHLAMGKNGSLWGRLIEAAPNGVDGYGRRDAGPALIRWYAYLTLWALTIGNKPIDSDEVPLLAFDEVGRVIQND